MADCGIPDLTIILYVDAKERRRRIMERNPADKDLNRKVFDNEPYKKMESFLDTYKMKYLCIDATNIQQDKVVDIIVNEILKIKETK